MRPATTGPVVVGDACAANTFCIRSELSIEIPNMRSAYRQSLANLPESGPFNAISRACSRS